MANHVTPYLTRRGNVFWFRMPVPRALVATVGRREIKLSLRTTRPEIARLRSRLLAAEFLQLIAHARPMPTLSKATIAQLARACFARALDEVDELTTHYIPHDREIDLEFEARSSLEDLSKLQKSLLVRPFEPGTIREAEKLLASQGIARKAAGVDDFEALCSVVVRARIEAMRIYAARLTGQTEDAYPKDPLFVIPPAGPMPATTGLTIRELADKYFAYKAGREWVGKSETENRRIIGTFMDLVGGERALASLGDADIRGFRDALRVLPANFRKRKGLERAEIRSILATATPQNAVRTATARKYFDNVMAFLQWCVDESYLDKLPGGSVRRFVVSRREAEEARQPFSAEQLRAFFGSPIYTGCQSADRRSKPGTRIYRDGKFWVPIIALFSGMRLGEIVQLQVTDVKDEGGVLYFDISQAEGEQKQIKTASSIRRVPVHMQLRRLGFDAVLDEARANNPRGRIFEDIAPGKDGYFSHNFSKWFGRYLKDIRLKDRRTTFHSFRHSFKDALHRAEVQDAQARELMGHSDSSVHGIYGSRLPVSALDASLQKIEYPIDWTALCASVEVAYRCPPSSPSRGSPLTSRGMRRNRQR